MIATEPRSEILYAHVQPQNIAFLHAEKKRLGHKTLSGFVDALLSHLRMQAKLDSVPHARKKKRIQKAR